MKYLLGLCLSVPLTLSTPAWGQKKLSPESFRINVRPVLNAIIHDFYQMISHFPDFPNEGISIMEQFDGLHLDKENLRQQCPRLLNIHCLSSIDSMRKKLSIMTAKTLEISSRQMPSQSLHLNTIGGMRLTSAFLVQLDQLKGLLDNSSLLLEAKLKVHTKTHEVIKEFDQLYTVISLAIIEFIPYSYRADFRHFFFNFVRPIELHISKNKNYEFVYRNVNALNFALNLLNMNLTKRNKKTPDGMKPYLNLIHNRWNSLLRYYF